MRKVLLALGFSAAALTSLASCDLDSITQGDEFTQCLGINNANDILTGLVNVSMDAQNCPRFENLYQETASSGAPNETTPGLNGGGLLYQGYVETSNVNVAEELVNMIQTQRAYEINSKAVSTSDQMLQKLAQL